MFPKIYTYLKLSFICIIFSPHILPQLFRIGYPSFDFHSTRSSASSIHITISLILPPNTSNYLFFIFRSNFLSYFFCLSYLCIFSPRNILKPSTFIQMHIDISYILISYFITFDRCINLHIVLLSLLHS